MTDPNTIAVAIRDKLRLIAALVTELGGDATKIAAFDEKEIDDGDLIEAINALTLGSILVVYNGTVLPQRQPYLHEFSIVLRPAQGRKPTDVQNLVINGVPTGSSLPFQLQQLTAALEPLQVTRTGRRSILIGEDSRLTYWEIIVQVREAGSY